MLKFDLLGDKSDLERTQGGAYSITIENGQIEFSIDEICQADEGNSAMLAYILAFDEVNLSFANTFTMLVIDYDGNFNLELMLPPDDAAYTRYIKPIDRVG